MSLTAIAVPSCPFCPTICTTVAVTFLDRASVCRNRLAPTTFSSPLSACRIVVDGQEHYFCGRSRHPGAVCTQGSDLETGAGRIASPTVALVQEKCYQRGCGRWWPPGMREVRERLRSTFSTRGDVPLCAFPRLQGAWNRLREGYIRGMTTTPRSCGCRSIRNWRCTI